MKTLAIIVTLVLFNVSSTAGAGDFKSPATLSHPATLSRHNFFYTGQSKQRRMFIVKDGRVTWTYHDQLKRGEISDAILLSDGHIVLAHQYGIAEVDSAGTTLWHYDAPEGTEIHTLQPIGRQYVVFVQNGRPAKVVVMQIPSCRVVREFPLPTSQRGSVHGQFRNARLTSRGTLLVANMGLGCIHEYTSDGREVDRWGGFQPWSVQELPRNGHLLVTGRKGLIQEIDRQGNVVWELNTTDYGITQPQKTVRLKNGNHIINNWYNEWGKETMDSLRPPIQAIEVDATGSVVWTLCQWREPDLGPCTTLQLLDDAVNRDRLFFGAFNAQRPKLMVAPNAPLGKGRGIHPGRVAWIHCPGVARWDGHNGLWVEDRWNDQRKADDMIREAILQLTGEPSPGKAWNALFRHFNHQHGRGNRGYKAGESIAVKLNMNNAITHRDTIELNSSPFVTLALVRSLVRDGGVRQQDIVLCEPSRAITDSIFYKVHREFPRVRFVDNIGGDGREECEYYRDQIVYSVDNGKMARGLARCIVDADYLINSALLKTHNGPGVTLTSKNWYGATDINLLWRQNAHNNISQDKRHGKPSYKTFVDWMSHKDMGQKTLLFIIDGTYGSRDVNGAPNPKWMKEPFNGDWACSLIVSQDEVACDAVAMDIIINEWPEFGSLNYCDEYLHEAATIPHTPSGTVYKQQRSPLTQPLGLFEHWDSNRKYTKIDLKYKKIIHEVAQILPVTDPAMKRSLNGLWQLKVVEGGDTIREASTIPVPGCWEAYGFCKPSYDRADSLTGYYRTTFSVPKEWSGQRLALRFDGVLYGYDLWVNDHFAGSWRSGYNTAIFDITDCIDKKAREQQLDLRVITRFPGSDFDYNDDWAPCGIFRDVTLMAVPETHLSDLTISTRNTGEVDVRTVVSNNRPGISVHHEILDAEGRFVGTDRVEHPHLWTAETPYLYTLRTTLTEEGRPLQTFCHRFGFRELTIDGNVLKLNGQPIKLRGVTCHSTHPVTVKVIDEASILHDMRLMKEASVNYIRTSHYPREPRFYELADSLGFYVIDEVPFGYGDKNLSDTAFYPILRQRAEATIQRDKNHPSVLIWSLGNENPLTDICIRLGHYVKQLDPLRPVCYPQVGSYFRRFNYDFPRLADIYAPHYPTTSQIAGFYQQADRPVIFTEYCHSLGISFEDHDRQWEIIERTPCIAGGSVWEWVDQGMPFRCEKGEEGSAKYGYEERVYTTDSTGFEMCGNKGTDGLLYADRTPLPNYYELQHNYARAFVSDSILMTASDSLLLHIVNRFDFLNLRDNVKFSWVLTADRDTLCEGSFSPDCQPHTTTTFALHLPPPVGGNLPLQGICRSALPLRSLLLPPSSFLLLSLSVTDAQGFCFLNQSIPVNPSDPTSRFIDAMPAADDLAASSVSPIIQTLVRVGRKATMAERLKVGDKRLERYLLPLTPVAGDLPLGSAASLVEKSFPHVTTNLRTEPVGCGTHYSVTLKPDSSDTFFSELGLAFLLAPHIDRVQWIGNGPYPTYPGRYRAGRYGFWALRQGDLYFEGNRRGVDAAWLSDADGNGVLIVCRHGNVSFEQTDRGIVLSCNAAVAGQGPKFARTAFPAVTVGSSPVTADFYLFPVTGDSVPPLLQTLFMPPKDTPEAYRPYVTQYDTYLMRFSDVCAF